MVVTYLVFRLPTWYYYYSQVIDKETEKGYLI